jgi:2-polyprenyl-3-methyl-5-hydroxy-6-metoxy-1,4-benzoquinol methylase
MTIWNERYAKETFAFGKSPNLYFKSIIDSLPPGKMLVPGAGEGRDAVYAAKLGWEVHAFDLSHIGQQKALKLAAEEKVSLRFEVLDAAHFDFNQSPYDLIAMVYFHLPEELRKYFFANLHQTLNPAGKVLIEAFNPKQLRYTSGGPKDPKMLLTPEILAEELIFLKPIECYEAQIVLDEGFQHQGEAQVVRYLGEK